MKKEIESIMDKQRKTLYYALWGNNDFAEALNIKKTIWNKKISPNSYSLDIKGNSKSNKRDGIKTVFAIENVERFNKKFDNEACDGSGNEAERITTLHSSALCALLFFYNVTKENPLKLIINEKENIFDKVFFEVQNRVIDGRNPSNMDVVLVGRQGNNKVLLFLESKFSEYYTGVGKCLNVSKEYLNKRYDSATIYRSKEFEDLGLLVDDSTLDENFKITSENKVYIEGVKQMISHYLGVKNFCEKEIDFSCKRQEKVKKHLADDTIVYLGTILFDKIIGNLKISGTNISCFESYRILYSGIANIINKYSNNAQIKMLSEPFTYSLFEDSEHKVEEKILKFYSMR